MAPAYGSRIANRAHKGAVSTHAAHVPRAKAPSPKREDHEQSANALPESSDVVPMGRLDSWGHAAEDSEVGSAGEPRHPEAEVGAADEDHYTRALA